MFVKVTPMAVRGSNPNEASESIQGSSHIWVNTDTLVAIRPRNDGSTRLEFVNSSIIVVAESSGHILDYIRHDEEIH